MGSNFLSFFPLFFLPYSTDRNRVERVVDDRLRQRDQQGECAAEEGDKGQDRSDAGELGVGERRRRVRVEAVVLVLVLGASDDGDGGNGGGRGP